MNNENKGFRSAINGYNRQDVNRFIEASHQRNVEQTEALLNELDQLRREKETLETQLAQQNDDSESAAIIGALNETVDRLLADKIRLEEENIALRAELDQIKSAPPAPEPLETGDEALSRRAVDVLMDARAMADRIIADARAAGQQELDNAHTRAKQQSDAIDHILRSLSDDCMAEYMVYLDSARKKIEGLLADAGNSAQIMQKRLDERGARAREEIGQEIGE